MCPYHEDVICLTPSYVSVVRGMHVSFSKAFLTTGPGNMEMARLLSHCRLFPILKMCFTSFNLVSRVTVGRREALVACAHVLMEGFSISPVSTIHFPSSKQRNYGIWLRVPQTTFSSVYSRELKKTQPCFGFLPSVTNNS
mgnify:CR=1 FL=1